MAALAQNMAQLQQAMAEQVQRAEARMAESGTRAKKVVDMKGVSVPMFNGEAKEFEDWAFAFKRVVRSVNTTAYDLLCFAERMPTNTVDEDVLELEFPGIDFSKYSAEIFDVLCQAVHGEALQLIRLTADMDGLTAWRRIYAKYSPKTMARAIRLIGQVTNPPRVKDLAQAELALNKRKESSTSCCSRTSGRSSRMLSKWGS